MRVAYITREAPFGSGEAFVLHEVASLIETGRYEITLLPRRRANLVHYVANTLSRTVVYVGLFDPRVWAVFFWAAAVRPRATLRTLRLVARQTRLWPDLLKGLIVCPKAIWMAGHLRGVGIGHIHAHSTTSSSVLAAVLAEQLDIGWSFTFHSSWAADRAHAPMIAEKVADASWVRCVSRDAERALAAFLPPSATAKLRVIPMGVPLPAELARFQPRDGLQIAVPAALHEHKGHAVLIEAMDILRRHGVRVKAQLFGDGPLRTDLRRRVEALGLDDIVTFEGFVPNEVLLAAYSRGDIDIVVLPSIRAFGTLWAQIWEGVPVALMEAMSYGIPVVGTNAGGVSELLEGGAGVLVEPDRAQDLADAIKALASPETRRSVGALGRARIESKYSSCAVAELLDRAFQAALAHPRRTVD